MTEEELGETPSMGEIIEFAMLAIGWVCCNAANVVFSSWGGQFIQGMVFGSMALMSLDLFQALTREIELSKRRRAKIQREIDHMERELARLRGDEEPW